MTRTTDGFVPAPQERGPGRVAPGAAREPVPGSAAGAPVAGCPPQPAAAAASSAEPGCSSSGPASDGLAWLEAADERVDAQLAAAGARARAMAELEGEIAAVRATGRAAGGAVRVEVDARGRLVGVRLTDAVGALRPAALARAIEDAARAGTHVAVEGAVALAQRRPELGEAVAGLVRAELGRA